MAVFIPAEFVCAVSGRIMRNPVEVRIDANDEYVIDESVYETAKTRNVASSKWDSFDFTKATAKPMHPLAERIKRWLSANGFSEAHADWEADPVLRLKVYGEFQQILQPEVSFRHLERVGDTTKTLAKNSFCSVLSSDDPHIFTERIDQINRALARGYPHQTITRDYGREYRWPKVFGDLRVQPLAQADSSFWRYKWGE